MRRAIIWTAALTLILEMLTIALRFGGGFESTRDTGPYLSPFTFGLRIHHGYIGGLLIVLAWVLARQRQRWARVTFLVGLSLLLSDLIHHFLVLWPITGSPQFDWVYPKTGQDGR